MLMNKVAFIATASLIALGACTQQEVVQYDAITQDTPSDKYGAYPNDASDETSQVGSGSGSGSETTASSDEISIDTLENPNPSSSAFPRSSSWPRSSFWPQSDPGLDLETSGLAETDLDGAGGGD